jgi:CheY-like chemotaxis protein
VKDVQVICLPGLQPGVALRCVYSQEQHLLGAAPLQIFFDSTVMTELLINLVQNAARFTTVGFVELHCHVRPRFAAPLSLQAACTDVLVSVRVRDSGSGIRPEDMETLFDKYSTAGGVGIGTYLSYRQVRAMGGTLVARSPWCEDTPGAEFSFEVGFPCRTPSAIETPPYRAGESAASIHGPLTATEWPSLPEGLHCLVADDMKVNVLMLKKALSKHCGVGWRVSETSTADDAIRLFERASHNGVSFALVVIDEHFDSRSSLKGSEAIRRMRAFERQAGSCRAAIVSCTGNCDTDGRGDDEEYYRQCGADAVWGKPFPNFLNGDMQQSLARVLGGAWVRPPPAPPGVRR